MVTIQPDSTSIISFNNYDLHLSTPCYMGMPILLVNLNTKKDTLYWKEERDALILCMIGRQCRQQNYWDLLICTPPVLLTILMSTTGSTRGRALSK